MDPEQPTIRIEDRIQPLDKKNLHNFVRKIYNLDLSKSSLIRYIIFIEEFKMILKSLAAVLLRTLRPVCQLPKFKLDRSGSTTLVLGQDPDPQHKTSQFTA